jgi:hypothetical protein
LTLVCPRCGLDHPESERFCGNCGMPLVHTDTPEEEPLTDAQERARKIRPQFARGELVRVTGSRSLADGELIQGILLDQGIPSLLRRARGFDVPDFLAAGPRDVLVPESGYERAREVLLGADLMTIEPPSDSLPGIGSPVRLAVGLVIALGIAALLVYLMYLATS